MISINLIYRLRKNIFRVTVMLFDLDRFKEVNDTYGHDAGDLLLREVSTRLNALSRFSGEHFIVWAATNLRFSQ